MKGKATIERWYQARYQIENKETDQRPCPSVIGIDDIHMLSPGDGYNWSDKSNVIGKKAIADIPRNEIIYPNMIE